MSTAFADTREKVIIRSPELRGAILELAQSTDLENGVDGPAGCVAGETRIYNPVTDEHITIKELYEKGIAPIVQTLMGAIQAEVPFRKGVRDLYRVTLASGRQCVVTDNHLFLSPDGWRFASSFVVGSRLLVSEPCPLPTTEVLAPSMSLRDALHLSQTPLGYREYCHVAGYSCGEPPLSVVGNALAPVPSQADAHVHSRVDLCRDDLDSSQGYTRQHQSCDRRAKTCYSPSTAYTACIQYRDRQETSLQVDALSRYDALSQKEKRPLWPIAQLRSDGDNMRHHAPLLEGYHSAQVVQSSDVLACSVLEQSKQCFSFSDKTQEPAETLQVSRVCSLSNSTSNMIMPSTNIEYTIPWDTVSSIKYERTDEYFDLHVPIAEHYLAEGIWHHNTGKTFGILYYIHILLLKYPNSKALVARKYNTDLAGSAMATYRDSVLDEREGVYYFGGNKIRPAEFMYPNGSELVVNGLDKPGKVKSMEFDIIYINEATECSLDDVEFCRMRVARRKNATIPRKYQKLIMDFNPDAPTHFLNQRMNDGVTRRILSRHEDNPFLFDLATNDWTEDGRNYIEGVLGGLTGVRLARYRYGIWAAADGTVYEDSYDRARNVIKRFTIPLEYPRYIGLDFGYTHPFVCKWYAEDPDGRLICYREIYMTKRLVEDHSKQIKQISRWGQPGGDPLPRYVIADHDAEDRRTFERHTGLMTLPAMKAVSEGIQNTASRLRPAGDGKPRLMYFEDALVERDPELVKLKKPTCTIEEFDSYVWKQDNSSHPKDEPVKEYDHGMDTDRYIVQSRDAISTHVKYGNRIY